MGNIDVGGEYLPIPWDTSILRAQINVADTVDGHNS